MATGKLRVISGMWLPRSALDALPETSTLAASSPPQTRQRVALSLRRVPQVGQSFVEVAEFLLVISELFYKYRAFFQTAAMIIPAFLEPCESIFLAPSDHKPLVT